MFDFNIADYKAPLLMPAGTYNVAVVVAEIRFNKRNSGEHLYLSFIITDGQFKNRLLETRFNTKNDNKTAEDMGRRSFSKFCESLGLESVRNPAELINKKCSAIVDVEFNEKFGDQNSITKFNKIAIVDAVFSESIPF